MSRDPSPARSTLQSGIAEDQPDGGDSTVADLLANISVQLDKLHKDNKKFGKRIDAIETNLSGDMRGDHASDAPDANANAEAERPPMHAFGQATGGDATPSRANPARNGEQGRAQPFNTGAVNVQGAQPFPFPVPHYRGDNPFPRPRGAREQVYAYNLREDADSHDLFNDLNKVRSQGAFEVRNLVPMLSYLKDLTFYAERCEEAFADDPEAAESFGALRDGIDSVFEFGHERLGEIQTRHDTPQATGLHEWIASRYDIDNRARSSRFVRRARAAHDSAVLGQVVKQGAATEGARVLFTKGAKAPPKPPAGAHGADESDDEANAARDKGKGKGKPPRRAPRQH